MNRDEFLQALRRHLSGDVPPDVVEENVRYYWDYINGEVSRGRSEAEVIEEIGDPRLIAKNIEDTTNMDEEESSGRKGGFGGAGSGYGSTGSGYGSADSGSGESGGDRIKRRFYNLDFSKWYVKALCVVAVIAVVVAVVVIAGLLIGGLIAVVIPVLIPVLFVLAVVWLIITIFNDSNRR